MTRATAISVGVACAFGALNVFAGSCSGEGYSVNISDDGYMSSVKVGGRLVFEKEAFFGAFYITDVNGKRALGRFFDIYDWETKANFGKTADGRLTVAKTAALKDKDIEYGILEETFVFDKGLISSVKKFTQSMDMDYDRCPVSVALGGGAERFIGVSVSAAEDGKSIFTTIPQEFQNGASAIKGQRIRFAMQEGKATATPASSGGMAFLASRSWGRQGMPYLVRACH